MKDLFRQVVTIIVTIAGIATSVFSITGPQLLSNNAVAVTGQQREVLLMPADLAFAIWGIIFSGWLASMVYQALPLQRTNSLLRRVSWLVSLNILASGLAVLVPGLPVLGLLLIIGSLLSLIAIHILLSRDPSAQNRRTFWFVALPFSVNLGWISAATIITTTQVLRYDFGLTGGPLSQEWWAVLMLIVATVLALAMVFLRKNIPFGIVITWALFWIMIKQSASPIVCTSAAILVGSLVVANLIAIVLRLRAREVGGYARVV